MELIPIFGVMQMLADLGIQAIAAIPSSVEDELVEKEHLPPSLQCELHITTIHRRQRQTWYVGLPAYLGVPCVDGFFASQA